MRMHSWFDIIELSYGINTMEDIYQNYSQEGMRESIAVITQLIEEEVEQLGGNHQKLFIGGFSQGCSLSLATFFNYEAGRELGGVVGLSGLMALKVEEEQRRQIMQDESKKKTPIFLYHGESDPTISCHMAKQSYEFLN
mmetsp:Transcript_1651/g.2923  ORF Transcript_1651/g.2923 Transcript_1651/m.2923 type:complete len:139 (+) Transcript_1651:329-745(+)